MWYIKFQFVAHWLNNAVWVHWEHYFSDTKTVIRVLLDLGTKLLLWIKT